jgi:Fe-S oxidoreductase
MRLPLLEERRVSLETCGYCPKLCRAACPVSNVEPRDTITPWGKMSIAWFVARGLSPVDPDHARVAWACTGCHACRELCDHRNTVADTLYAARAEFLNAEVAPAESAEIVAKHPQRLAEAGHALSDLARVPGVDDNAPTALLVGCAYLRHAASEARDAVAAAAALAGPVRLVDGCCGAPLLYAGDRAGFAAAKDGIRRALAGCQAFLAVDPGCAVLLRELGATTLVELAARQLVRLRRAAGFEDGGPLRWHDPCQLGRGLGVYDAPRAVLARALGRAPEEFSSRRERAACSGAGGLLPAIMPENSAGIADARLADHERLGGGTVVTACAASLRRLRSRGARVIDLHTVIRKSATPDG